MGRTGTYPPSTYRQPEQLSPLVPATQTVFLVELTEENVFGTIEAPHQVQYLLDVIALARRIFQSSEAIRIYAFLLQQETAYVSDVRDVPIVTYNEATEIDPGILAAVRKFVHTSDLNVISSRMIPGEGQFRPDKPANIYISHAVGTPSTAKRGRVIEYLTADAVDGTRRKFGTSS